MEAYLVCTANVAMKMPDSTPSLCSNCQRLVFVSPAGHKQLKRVPESIVICVECLDEIKATGNIAIAPVQGGVREKQIAEGKGWTIDKDQTSCATCHHNRDWHTDDAFCTLSYCNCPHFKWI